MTPCSAPAPDGSIADCTEAIRLKPDFAEAYYLRGIAYVATDDHDKGAADKKRAKELAPSVGKSYIRAAEAQVKAFKTPLQAYRIDIGTYPNSSQGLESLRNPPSDLTSPTKWRGPYLDAPVPADPWSNPYRYEYPGKFQEDWPDIWSCGPDGIDGTDDDIGNWIVAE